MVTVWLQNKVKIIPLVEFGSNLFGNGRHRASIVTDAFPLLDQVQECCLPIGHLATDFLKNALWNCSDDYRIHWTIGLPSPRLSVKNVVEAG